jgi:hypothetical protein
MTEDNPVTLTAEPRGREVVIARVFDAPRELVFKTCTDPNLIKQWWGPLTRNQIKQLMDSYKSAQTAAGPTAQPTAATTPATSVSQPASAAPLSSTPAEPFQAAPATAAAAGLQPTLPPDVTQFFIPVRGSGSSVTYQPMVLGAAKVRFADLKTRVDASRDVVALTPVVDEAVPVDWNAAQTGDFSLNDLEKTPTPGLRLAICPVRLPRRKIILAGAGTSSHGFMATRN